MADLYVINGSTLTAIADSIRAKTGAAGLIPTTAMPTAIDGITGGGGGSADVRYVTFTNASTGETFVKPVAVGDDCVDVVAKGLWAKPTQESTAQYDYAFANGWSATPGGTADANILKNITEDKTVYAVFTATVRYYTITWLDEDGVTELPGQKQWAYGTVPSYTPTKEGVFFKAWSPTPVAVTGDASYVAEWTTQIDLETASWDTIINLAESGEASSYLVIGDQKTMELNHADGTTETVVVEIAGFGHDTGVNSQPIGISFVTKQVSAKTVKFAGVEWPDDPIRTYLNSDLLNAFPPSVKSVVKQVVKKNFIGIRGGTNRTETTNEYVWIPSVTEFGCGLLNDPANNIYPPLEDPQAYPLYTTYAARVRLNADGTSATCWTRTQYQSTTHETYIKNDKGNCRAEFRGDATATELPLMFGFCI